MRVLVNATTLVVGGGVQVGASFIEYASNIESSEGLVLLFVVSEMVYRNISSDLQRDNRVKLIPISPARLVTGFSSRLALRKIERAFLPDVVYSVGAPSYIRFHAQELVRFTWPWGTHPSSLAWSIFPLRHRILRWLEVQYKLWWLRRVPYFETQTETAAKGIKKRLSIGSDHIRIIPNAFSPVFNQMDLQDKGSLINNDKVINILTLAAPYPHKNLLIIPKIAAIINNRSCSVSFRFIVTLPDNSGVTRQFMKSVKELQVENYIENLGQVQLSDCPGLYRRAHIVFLPTLLETFSVTYLEAMQMGRPIVTTDLDFSHDICEDAALYFEPLSAVSAVDVILQIVNDPALMDQQISNGKKRLQWFPKPHEKYQMVIDWIREVAEKKSFIQGSV